MQKKNRWTQKTGLNHTLRWYADNYGLAFNTVRRNRTLLDKPQLLLAMLLTRRGPQPDVRKLAAFIRGGKS